MIIHVCRLASASTHRFLPMSTFYFYQLFGQTVRSELPCPELRAGVSTDCPDIRFERSSLPPSLDAPAVDKGWIQTRPGACQIQIDEVARYRIQDGQVIQIHPLDGADAGDHPYWTREGALDAIVDAVEAVLIGVRGR